MKVQNRNGEEFELTKDEVKFLNAIKKLEKMKQGRFILFGNDTLSVRMGGRSAYREIYSTKIICDGGDGGDDFD